MKLSSVISLAASLQVAAALDADEWAASFLKGGCVADWTKLNYQEGGHKDKTLDCMPVDATNGGYTNVDIRNFKATGKKLTMYKSADVNDPFVHLCGDEVKLGELTEDGCYPLPDGTDPTWYTVHNV